MIGMMSDTAPSLSAEARPTVLLVDDSPDNLRLLAGLLKNRYNIRLANNGDKALVLARANPPPDLILLDVMMPGIDGYEVCGTLQSDPATSHIPIIFLTALTSPEDEERGLALGGVDYVTKPISPAIVLARVKTHLNQKAMADFLRDKNHFLEKVVAERTRKIQTVQDVTILAMASLAETRDNETGNHIRRTQHYVKLLAEHLAQHPRFSAFLSDETIKLLFKSAPLHDIGKVGIPDAILLKPGRLTGDEFAIMKTHAAVGREAIRAAEAELGERVEFLQIAKEISYSHHEKWDGSGYPEGLAGEEIPASARLMAIADVYDALISRRVYKEPMPHEKAIEIIREGRGRHFDPDMVDAFLALGEHFRQIAERYADSHADIALKAGKLACSPVEGQTTTTPFAR